MVYLYRWLQPYWNKEVLPYFTYFITNKCNLKCKMCFYHKQPKVKELSVTELGWFSQSVGKINWLGISGGEPFLSNKLVDTCKLFCRNCKVLNLTIPTNGTLPNTVYHYTKQILKDNPETYVHINLSIHGIGKEHDAIVGHEGAFRFIKRTYKNLVDLKKKYKNLFIGTITTQSKYNEDNIIQTIDFIRKHFKVDNVGLGYTRGNPRDSNSHTDYNKYLKNSKYLINTKKNTYNLPFNKIILNKDRFRNKIILNTIKYKKPFIKCLAGKHTLVMDEQGNIYPCEQISKPITNIRYINYNFKRIKRNIIPNCYCTHECFMDISILYNFKQLYKIIKVGINV